MSQFRPIPLIRAPTPPAGGEGDFSELARLVEQQFETATAGARFQARQTEFATQEELRTQQIQQATAALAEDEQQRERVKIQLANSELEREYDKLRDVERFGWSALQTQLSPEERVEAFRTYRWLDPENQDATANALADDLTSTDYMRILREEAQWNRDPNNPPNSFNSDEAFARILQERDLPTRLAEPYQKGLLDRLRAHSEGRFNAQSRLENQQIAKKAENRLTVSGKLWTRKRGSLKEIEDAARSLSELRIGTEATTESDVKALMAEAIGTATSIAVKDVDQATSLSRLAQQVAEIDDPELQEMLELYDTRQKIDQAIDDFNRDREVEASQTLLTRGVDARTPEQLTALIEQAPKLIQDETLLGTTLFDLENRRAKLAEDLAAERQVMAALSGQGPPSFNQMGVDAAAERLRDRGVPDEDVAVALFSKGMPLYTAFRKQMEAAMDPQFPNYAAPLSFLRRLEALDDPEAANRFVRGLENGDLLEAAAEVLKDHRDLSDPFARDILGIIERADATSLMGDVEALRSGQLKVATTEGEVLEIDPPNINKATVPLAKAFEKAVGVIFPTPGGKDAFATLEGAYADSFWAYFTTGYINGMTNARLGVSANKEAAIKRATRIASVQAGNNVSTVRVPGIQRLGSTGSLVMIDRVPGLGTANEPGPLSKEFDRDIHRYYNERTGFFRSFFGANIGLQVEAGFMDGSKFIVPEVDDSGVVRGFMEWETRPEALEDRLTVVPGDDSRFPIHLAQLNRFSPGQRFRTNAHLDRPPQIAARSVEETQAITGRDLSTPLTVEAERLFFTRMGRWPDYRNAGDKEKMLPLMAEVATKHDYDSWGDPKKLKRPEAPEPEASRITAAPLAEVEP